ncbi:MAG TPA: LamG domain-containing protein [Polyangiaceae bacterium]|nr:LamG domain-containing protein [Polyangiaceae bacterium]
MRIVLGLAAFIAGCGPTYIDATGLAPTTLGTGLVAHWTFDDMDGSVLLDDSGNRRDGTVSGATFRADGRFGGALHFVPGDSVTVGNFPYATSSWTFSGWVHIGDEDSVTDDFGTLVSTETMQQDGGWEFQTRGRSAGIYWTFAYWLGPGRGYAHYDCQCFELGRWSHATVVVDGARSRLSFYVDGQLADTNALPGAISPGTSDLLMGKWDGPARLFSGAIDDVAIYNRALSAAEVAELDARPAPRPR